MNARFLKNFLLLIIPQLAYMFNDSLSAEEVGCGHHRAHPQTGDLPNLSNWHPITLLLAISKIMERITHKQHMSDILSTNKLSEH